MRLISTKMPLNFVYKVLDIGWFSDEFLRQTFFFHILKAETLLIDAIAGFYTF